MLNKEQNRYTQTGKVFEIYDYLKTHRATAIELAEKFHIHKRSVNRHLAFLSTKRPLYIVNESERYNRYVIPMWGVLKGGK